MLLRLSVVLLAALSLAACEEKKPDQEPRWASAIRVKSDKASETSENVHAEVEEMQRRIDGLDARLSALEGVRVQPGAAAPAPPAAPAPAAPPATH